MAAAHQQTVDLSSVQVVRDPAPYCQFAATSIPIRTLPAEGAAAAEVSLPLFGAASAYSVSTEEEAEAAPASKPRKKARLDSEPGPDLLLHAGGLVWALDWCPFRQQSSGSAGESSGLEGQPEYLAVGAHPKPHSENLINRPITGPGMLQLWRIPSPATDAGAATAAAAEAAAAADAAHQAAKGSKGARRASKTAAAGAAGSEPAPLPKLVMGICHEGGVVWDCKWCPDHSLPLAEPASQAGCAPNGSAALGPERLGLLAVVLGNGDVQVLAVPAPLALRASMADSLRTASQDQAGPAERALPELAVRLQPVAHASAAALSGSLASTLEWLPSAPHDLLLVGCWDGSVAMFRLRPALPAAAHPAPSEPATRLKQSQRAQHAQQAAQQSNAAAPLPAGASLELLLHVPADPVPLRAVSWLPAPLGLGSSDLAHRHMFVTAGHAGVIKVWDARDACRPLVAANVGTQWILSADWLPSPLGVVAALDDCSFRFINLGLEQYEKGHNHSTMSHKGARTSALWSVHYCHRTGHIAYGGQDGEVALAVPAIAFAADSRKRGGHVPLAGWRKEGDTLVLQTAAALDARGLANHVLEGANPRQIGRTKSKPGAEGQDPEFTDLPDLTPAIRRVRWSPNGTSAIWLAHGGTAGVVRCQRLAVE